MYLVELCFPCSLYSVIKCLLNTARVWHVTKQESKHVQATETHCLSKCSKMVLSEAEASVAEELGGGGFGAEGRETAGGRGAAGALTAAGLASPTLKS